ncbi:ICP22 family protein [Streptomyces jumonjinensis]|uniref:Tat pathway signal sequence domain protein n=1 Tax=Streptomyces jumonjinensis TaxID=1945 RepID=A0A646KP16_STRJU|nr:hypothetical protein [Streptomyces jumonjinensis]MQT03808.1 hypothetical protein [Streptomyces jumonjinensis]
MRAIHAASLALVGAAAALALGAPGALADVDSPGGVSAGDRVPAGDGQDAAARTASEHGSAPRTAGSGQGEAGDGASPQSPQYASGGAESAAARQLPAAADESGADGLPAGTEDSGAGQLPVGPGEPDVPDVSDVPDVPDLPDVPELPQGPGESGGGELPSARHDDPLKPGGGVRAGSGGSLDGLSPVQITAGSALIAGAVGGGTVLLYRRRAGHGV